MTSLTGGTPDPLYSPALPAATVAMRVGIIDTVANEFRYYSTATWRETPFGVCEMYMRRLAAFGYLLSREAVEGLNRWAFVDAMGAEHDILETYQISEAGLKYLRREWRVGLTRRRSYAA